MNLSTLIAIVMIALAMFGGLMFQTVKYDNQLRKNAEPLGCKYLGSPRDLHEVEFYSCGPNNEIITAFKGQPPKYKGE